jgi:hypothetical protein
MSNTIGNFDAIIDSRDVIARIAELRANRDSLSAEDAHELAALEALAEEASGSPDWRYGEVLIRGSYFKEYAAQLAEDTGLIKADACWPYTCIDWDQAARELQHDYMLVDFDGVAYWVHA